MNKLIGHEDKVTSFKKLVEENTLGAAYLFYGDPQIGKRTFAKHLINLLEWGAFEAPTRPWMDALIIEGDETIGVNVAAQIKNFLFQKPLRAARRSVLVDCKNSMTTEAEAALLKVIEEPPESALVILVAHSEDVLSPPLLSRLRKVYFERLPRETLEKTLISECNLPPLKAKIIALQSFGRIGRAEELMAGTKREGIEEELEKRIIELFLHDPVTNGTRIAKLLNNEATIKSLNINKLLYEKLIRSI